MTAPLVLLSELRRQINSEINSDKATAAQIVTANLRLRELIQSASETFTDACNKRRFDRYYDTRHYTPYLVKSDGDLLSAWELLLDADLISVDVITNGDDTAITTGYQLTPRNEDAKQQIVLNRNGTVYWTSPGGTDDPINSISVAATWGYGGSFESTGDAVQDDPLAVSATTIDVTDGDNFEVGMMLSIEDEYTIVESISTNTLTVERGYNGTTAAAHNQTTAINYFLAERRVRQSIIRLVSWSLEQYKSPMFGTIVIADVSLPTTVDGMPNDVVKMARSLRRPNRIY